MTSNEINSNLYIGWFLGGIGFSITCFVIFQIGLNLGIKIVSQLIEHEYPAAFKFLEKNKNVARIYPYVIGGQE